MSVFISHSHQDQEFVNQLCLRLIKRNVKVWRDEWKMSPGHSLPAKIQEAIEQASIFCVVVSESSNQSDWGAQEIGEALRQETDKKTVILPLILELCEVPDNLKDYLHVDFRQDFERGLRQVLRVVERGYERRYSGTAAGGACHPFFIHWGREIGERDGKFFLQLDTVSVDVEEDTWFWPSSCSKATNPPSPSSWNWRICTTTSSVPAPRNSARARRGLN